MLILKNFLYRIAYRILDSEIYRDTGYYEIRNCKHGLQCHLRGNIDKKISTKKVFPRLEDESSTYSEATCGLCAMGIRVENAWPEIQKNLYLDRAFIIHKKDIEPEEYAENRQKMLAKLNEPQVMPSIPAQNANPRAIDQKITSTDDTLSEIRKVLCESHSGEGYGNQKLAAEIAVRNFGRDWTKKFPDTEQGVMVRSKLQQIVKDTTPDWHSNHYVIWQRLQDYGSEK